MRITGTILRQDALLRITPSAPVAPPSVCCERGNLVKSVIGSVTSYTPRREYELRVEGASEAIVKYYFTTAGRTRDEMHRQGRLPCA